jgi:hypothetical protein
MNELFQPGQHPDADQLSAFAEQALPAHEQQQMLAHLAHCAVCREVVFLAEEAAVVAQAAPLPASNRVSGGLGSWLSKWFSGWNLAWSAAALACLIVLAVQLHRFKARSSGDASTTIASNTPSANSASVSPQAMPAQQQVAPQGNALQKPSTHLAAQSKPDTTSVPVTTTLSNQLVDSATLTGRNTAELARIEPTPATPAGKAAAAENLDASIKARAMAAPQDARTMTVISGQEAEVPVDSAEVSATLNEMQVTSAAISQSPVKLPSHLAVASMVSKGRFSLAIDAAGSLFASKDAGKHWKAISAPWTGRAVKVEFASAPQQVAAPAPRLQTQSEAKLAPPAVKAAAAPVASAQAAPPSAYKAGSGQVTGVVTDQTGAVVPGTKLMLVNTASGATRSVVSRQDGYYIFEAVAPGVYSLRATAPGFLTWTENGIAIPANAGASINIKLTVGSAATTVTVTADALAMQTDSSVVSTPINGENVTTWPEVFELTTENGAVWVSSDGRHWKRK